MFLPRSLTSSRSTTKPQTQHSLPPQPAAIITESATDEGPGPSPTQDPTILCSLAFSDYQLWSNPSLRDPNRDGFVPLRTVMHTSSVFLAANSASLTEAAVVKSLRAHARDTFDIRMIVVDKTRSRRGHHGYAPAGGYEVRRKDWAEVTQRFPTFSAESWDARTIYIENIPPSSRSIVGISKLLQTLLPSDRSGSSYRSIQNIYFPPHHQDPPDTQPKCKGFALLTLSEPSATSHLLARFPYHHHKLATKSSAATLAGHDNDHHDETSAEELEARKAGFRTLSKDRWEALQNEYVEYRDALLHRNAMSSSSLRDQASTTGQLPYKAQAPLEAQPRCVAIRRSPPPASPRCTFPPGCVIFARHIPTDTNKTALRAQFSALLALADDSDNDDDATASATALDYVDYTKGLDSCYLRLATREHALLLLQRFERRAGEGEEEQITLELLDGRREEMYWEGVPDKVRALAVQRFQALEARQGDDDVARTDDDQDASRHIGARKRRRRRR